MQADFLVIGSGLAGLSYALDVADHGSVLIITKKEPEESNTAYAQGGIAAVITEDDSTFCHAEDTIKAGAGLCNKDAVQKITSLGPNAINQLIKWGVKFEEFGPDAFDLNIEGGHKTRRILHSGDSTGKSIIDVLLSKAKSHPNIQILPYHIAIDLVPSHKFDKNIKNKCLGAYVLNTKTNKIISISSKLTILATGGAGKVYLYTSNPDISSGDGIAMAYRAGISIANMEFVQFHPTCLWHPKAKSFLISEAVRGEGAWLLTCNGKRFMKDYDNRLELATRDIVARAMDMELKKSGDDYLLLDTTHIPSDKIKKRFPNIYETCLSYGLDITKEPIPVVPAAHYFCGGVKTDINGKTSLPGLFAAGEVACNGLHGANRLASNSLLEAITVSKLAALEGIKLIKDIKMSIIPSWDSKGSTDSDEEVVITQNWDEVRRLMWNFVGIVRTTKRLKRALKRLELLQDEIKEYYWNFTITSDLIELRNIALVASLIVNSALNRNESRGLHYMRDFPNIDDKHNQNDTIIIPNQSKKPLIT